MKEKDVEKGVDDNSSEEEELVEKLEDSCLRYDHDKKGVRRSRIICQDFFPCSDADTR